jgi:hypothetical protein
MSEKTDYQRYLDEKFKSIEKMLDQNHAHTKLELKQIRENTEKTNGKVADQEKRIRYLENSKLGCPINQVVEKQKKIEQETEKMRAFLKLFKGSAVLAFLTAIGLLLQMLNVI